VAPFERKLDPQFMAKLKSVIMERRAHCPRCGYDLSGAPGPRCPECGKNVREILRVADTTPWRLPESRRRAAVRWVLRKFGAAALVGGSVAVLAWSYLTLTGAWR